MGSETQRPGVLLYFDSFGPAVEQLDNEELGGVVRAIIGYARYGLYPDELEGRALFAFSMLRPTLDRDADAYERRVDQSRWKSAKAALKQRLTREHKPREEIEEALELFPPFDEWLARNPRVPTGAHGHPKETQRETETEHETQHNRTESKSQTRIEEEREREGEREGERGGTSATAHSGDVFEFENKRAAAMRMLER